MKKIKKYKTFERLKSDEKAASDTNASLKKHARFEMLVNKIYRAKIGKGIAFKAATLNGKKDLEDIKQLKNLKDNN